MEQRRQSPSASGLNVERNPKKINFLPELKPDRPNFGPISEYEEDPSTVVDPWGEEYYMLMDADNSGTIATGSAVKAIVKAEIISDLVQGDKVIAFKMKRRKGFRKKHGHRTHYTRIKIESIA